MIMTIPRGKADDARLDNRARTPHGEEDPDRIE
jgi:hypothetical protein